MSGNSSAPALSKSRSLPLLRRGPEHGELHDEDEFFKKYMCDGRSVLDASKILQSQADTSYTMPFLKRVCEFFVLIIPPPAQIFTEIYFSRPTYPLKVFSLIAELCGFESTEPVFLSRLELADYDTDDKRIMNHVWFASLSEHSLPKLEKS